MAKLENQNSTESDESRPADEITSDVGVRNKKHLMGLWGAISFVAGSIIGSGIFISPSTILKETNSVGLSLVIWVLSSAVSSIGAYCYVELGTSIKKSGSDFAYMNHMKMKSVAFAFSICTCFITHTSTLAIQALTFAEYFRQGLGIRLADPQAAHLFNVIVSFTTIGFLTFLNFYSIRTVVSRFQMVASFAKIASTLLIISVGCYYLVFHGRNENLQNVFEGSQFSAGNLVSAFFAGLLAYDGWDVLNMGAEEIKNPRRTMPLAIGIGMAGITFLFVLVNISYSVILNVKEIQQSDAVAMSFADKAIGPFRLVVPFMICVVLIGSLNSTLFMGSRALHAVARSGLMPPFLSCWSEKRGSPRAAIVAHVLAALVMALAGDVRQLINFKGFSAWSQRTVTIILLIVIRLRRLPVDPNRVRTPILMPFLFVLCTSALVITTVVGQTRTALFVSTVLAFGFSVYFVFIWDQALPRFRLYNVVRNRLNAVLNKLTEIVFRGKVENPQKVNKIRPLHSPTDLGPNVFWTQVNIDTPTMKPKLNDHSA